MVENEQGQSQVRITVQVRMLLAVGIRNNYFGIDYTVK